MLSSNQRFLKITVEIQHLGAIQIIRDTLRQGSQTQRDSRAA